MRIVIITLILMTALSSTLGQSNRRVKTHFYVRCAGQTTLIRAVEIREGYVYAYLARPIPRHSLRGDKWRTYLERCRDVEARRVSRVFGLKPTPSGYFAK